MDIKDYTDKEGHCSESCGKCCTSILPVSLYELNKIKKFLRRNKIVPNKNLEACPFLTEDKKCAIYIHRPEICQKFMCNAPLQDFYHFDKNIVDLRAEFFPDQPHSDPQDIERLNLDYLIKKNKVREKMGK